jgi:hypothetical protein
MAAVHTIEIPIRGLRPPAWTRWAIASGLAVLLAATVLTGVVGAVSTHVPPTANRLDAFGGTAPGAVATHHLPSLYRERARSTRFTLHRIACAPVPGLSRSTACFAAAG